ncbi:hypothetical protein LSTR_LSTR001744 [Laodelphax striatellus]|uniref:Uncharacterized protein n=1 Tax=Laodelphax striatellus TaxID=195883 RepID=A0A482XCQ0_LAOST|nr:hypothetical protein LSTR_LSTR001744 [Laodelphax striatellus]
MVAASRGWGRGGGCAAASGFGAAEPPLAARSPFSPAEDGTRHRTAFNLLLLLLLPSRRQASPRTQLGTSQ